MIGIYRLLDKIEKSDGALVGSLVKADRELSFSSLLSAVRSKKSAGIDLSVDDEFGEISSAGFKNTSIDSQIRAAYNSNIAGKLKSVISPKVLLDAMEGHDSDLENLYDTSLEEDLLESQEYYEQVARDISETMKGMNEELSRFLTSLDLPDNITNLKLASEYMASNNSRNNKLWSKEESESIIENFDNPEALEEEYIRIDKKHEKEVETEKESDDISYEGLRDLEAMARGISFFGKLRKKQYYEIPIFTENGIMSESEKKGLVEIYMNSEEFGKIQASFKASSNKVRGYVTAQKKESLEKLNDIMKNFEMDLEESGFTMESNNMLEASRRFSQKDIDEGAKNRDLYKIAKMFIENISRM